MPRIPIPEGFSAGAVRPPADPREEVLAELRTEDAELRAVEAGVRTRRAVAETRAEALEGLAGTSGSDVGLAALATYDAAGRGRLEGLPEDERPALRRDLGAAREGVRMAAHVAEAAARDAARLDDLDATVAANRAAVRRDPGQLDALVQESAATIAAAGLTPAASAARLAAAREDLAESAVLGLLDRDPEAASAALDRGPVARYLPTEAAARVRVSATVARTARQAEAARRDHLARQGVRRAMARHLDAVGRGETGRESAALRRQSQAVLGDEAARAFDRDLGRAHVRAAAAAELAHAHPEAMDPIIVAAPADVRPRLDADKARLMAERAEDPAGAAARAPEIAELYEAAAVDPAHLEAAIDAGLDRQADLGIPEDDRRPLPRDQAQAIAAEIEARPAAKRGPALGAALDWAGDHRTMVLHQLAESGLSPETRLLRLASADPLVSLRLSQAATADQTDLAQGLDPEAVSEVRSQIEAELRDGFPRAIREPRRRDGTLRPVVAKAAVAEEGDPAPESEIPPIPDEKTAFFKGAEGAKVWADWVNTVRGLPGITRSEERAYLEIFAVEDGVRKDKDSTASSGITLTTLNWLRRKGVLAGIPASEQPIDLTLAQRAAVYRAYFDDVLDSTGKNLGVPGHQVIGLIRNELAAASFADLLFRGGRKGGVLVLQEAIVNVGGDLSREHVDGAMGPKTFAAFVELSENSRTLGRILDKIADLRNESEDMGDEESRNNYFRFLKERSAAP